MIFTISNYGHSGSEEIGSFPPEWQGQCLNPGGSHSKAYVSLQVRLGLAQRAEGLLGGKTSHIQEALLDTKTTLIDSSSNPSFTTDQL